MKVIGTTPKGYMIEATREEIANLVGYSSNWNTVTKAARINVGDEILIHEMYKQLYQLAKNHGKIGEIAEQLMKMSEQLVLLEPVKITVPELEK